jgi:hypothetical protein
MCIENLYLEAQHNWESFMSIAYMKVTQDLERGRGEGEGEGKILKSKTTSRL